MGIRVLVFVCLFLTGGFLGAQTRDHEVQKGETIYGISKLYGIPGDELIRLNPTLKTGLQEGSIIKVPSGEKKNPKQQPVNITEEPARPEYNGREHVVTQGETLYGISKKYTLSQDALQKANPGVDFNQLKPGQLLRIPTESKNLLPARDMYDEEDRSVVPIKKAEADLPTGSETQEEIAQGDSATITLFLPLYRQENDSVLRKALDGSLETGEKLFGKSVPAFEFLAGMQLAFDSLNKAGKKYRIRVLDCPVDSSEAERFFESQNFGASLCWIGPFHPSPCAAASRRAAKEKVPYIIPFAAQNKLLIGNTKSLKIATSSITQMEYATARLTPKFLSAKKIIVHNALSKEKAVSSTIRKKFLAIREKGDTLYEVIYKNEGFKGLSARLSSTSENIIYIPSSDQAFVSDLVNKLSVLTEEYKVVLVGMEGWINYENLDAEQLQRLKTILPSDQFVNYSSAQVKRMVGAYRAVYQTEPGRFAFSGYDLGFYLNEVQNLQTFDGVGKPWQGLQHRFEFKAPFNDAGFENQGIYLLQFKNGVPTLMD